MKRILLSILALGAALTMSAQAFRCADPEATPEAQKLLERLVRIRDKGIMYGHQDDLLTGYTWWEVEGNSDTKANTGDYPAIAGCELGELELGKDRSLDSVSFAHMRKMAKWFFDSMAFKTMLRQLISKWGIMSIDMVSALDADMAVINEDGTKEYVDTEPDVIDMPADEVSNQPQEEPKAEAPQEQATEPADVQTALFS